MSNVNSSSASITDRTSASAPPTSQTSPQDAATGTTTERAGSKDRAKSAAESSGSEVEFLQLQADLAQAALKNTLRRLGNDLIHGVDPRAWMQDYPWWTLLGAAVGGFAMGAAVTPPKIDEETRKEMEREKRLQNSRWRSMVAAAAASRAAAEAEREREDGHTKDGHGKATFGAKAGSKGGGLLSGIVKTGFDILKPVIISAISAATAAQAGPAAVASQQATTRQTDPDAAA